MAITQQFNLNMIPDSAPVVVHVDQYDVGEGRLVAKLYKGSAIYTPAAGATAIIQGMKPDKHGFDYEATISGSTVIADLTEQMTAKEGNVRVQLVINEGENRTGTFVFTLAVQKSALPADSDLSRSDLSYIEGLIDEAESLDTQSDWTETDTESRAYIKNKPSIPASQVNADWNATSGVAEILNKPTLGTAAALNVAASGDASISEVVKGDDTRLTDARNAADVYPWAKAENKPTYTANEVGAIASTEKGTNGGVAELDANGKVPSAQLPSYVDDVLEYASLSAFPVTGETGKIYVALDTNKTYRWSGSAYVEISESLALGETSSTAYAGNKGKANADAIAAIKDGQSIDSFADVETALVGKADTSDIPDITGKADKVSSPVSGNFAGLDSNGNLTDSGKKASDFQTTLTFDNMPIDGSNNPVKSQGIKMAIDDSQKASESLLRDTVGWTGKNLLPINLSLGSETARGITWNVNSDKTITVQPGTASSTLWVGLVDRDLNVYNLSLKAGTYKLSSSQTMPSKMQISVRKYNDVFLCNLGNGDNLMEKEFILEQDTNVFVGIRFGEGLVLNNTMIIKPMIRKADIADPTYEPYHESVETMFEEEIHGVNLLKNEASTRTNNGVTFTVNSDGSITANGTATADATCFIQGSGWNYNATVENFLEQGETYILSDGVNSYTGNKNVPNIRMYGYTSAGAAWNYEEITPNTNKTFTVDANMKACHISVYIRVPSGMTVNNVVFKPMLRKADIEDSAYRPYNEQAIQNQLNAQGVLGAKNLLKVTTNTRTVNGVTYTFNRDSEGNVINIVPTGTASDNSYAVLWNRVDDKPLKGLKHGIEYTLSGASRLGAGNGYVYVNFFTGSTRIGGKGTDQGTGDLGKVNFIIPNEADAIDFGLAILNGKSAPTGFAFYPMVTLASDPDDTYVPYAMTNKELTELLMKKTLESSDDLNDVTTDGIYSVGGAPINSPESSGYGMLIVKNNANSNIKQLLVVAAKMYVRSYGGSPASWGSWYKFEGTVVT